MKLEFFGNGGDVHSLRKINPSTFMIRYKSYKILFNPGINSLCSLISDKKNIRDIDVICITGEDIEESGDLGKLSYLKSYDGFDPQGILILKRSIKKDPKKIIPYVFANFERIISLEDNDNVEINSLKLKAVKSEVSEDKLNYIINTRKNNILIVDSKESLYEITERFKSRKFDTLILNTKGFKLDEISDTIEDAKYFAIFDSDDVCLKDRLEKQVEFLEKNQDYGVLGSHTIIIDGKGDKIGFRNYPLTNKEVQNKIVLFSPLAQPVATIRKSVLEDIGYYNEDFVRVQDYELWFRIAQKYKVGNVDKALLKYRVSLEQGKNKHLKLTLKNTLDVQKGEV